MSGVVEGDIFVSGAVEGDIFVSGAVEGVYMCQVS